MPWVLLAWWSLSIAALGYACSNWNLEIRWMGWVFSVLGPSVLLTWAWRGWRGQKPGEWAWDGEQWAFQTAAAQSGSARMTRLDVVFDFQHMVLLRAHSFPNITLWSLVSRADAPHLWHDFRCAVYSRASRFC